MTEVKINEKVAELAHLMSNGDPSVRQGALKGLILSFVKSTKLSKADVRQVSRDFAPVVINQSGKPNNSKKIRNRDGPAAQAIKSNTTTYPLNQRGPGSKYATAIRNARATDKQAKPLV